MSVRVIENNNLTSLKYSPLSPSRDPEHDAKNRPVIRVERKNGLQHQSTRCTLLDGSANEHS